MSRSLLTAGPARNEAVIAIKPKIITEPKRNGFTKAGMGYLPVPPQPAPTPTAPQI